MCLDLLRRIRRFRPDVIHLQQGHFWFNLFLRSVRTPVVLTIHDLKPHVGDRGGIKTPELIMNLAFRRADRVILHAERMRNDAIARNISPNLIDVIPHVAIGSELRVQPIFEEDHLILFFGRIWPYKGLEYLIRAEPFISSRVPDVKFVIAGEGEDFSRYRALMVHPERFVVHNEFVSNEKRAELFARAAIVVLPYIEASQSGVVPVAYSFSKPVVATTVGGLPEVVEDGRTGYLVPPGDELALADAVETLTHEATHIGPTPLEDEDVVECYALQHMRRSAIRLGASRALAVRLSRRYWRELYPTLPSKYRSPECRENGTLDLHTPGAAWD
jgi:glycosyltransferase involved in cell wall biosynthesis